MKRRNSYLTSAADKISLLLGRKKVDVPVFQTGDSHPLPTSKDNTLKCSKCGGIGYNACGSCSSMIKTTIIGGGGGFGGPTVSTTTEWLSPAETASEQGK